jgi:hypothetical protein
MTAATETKIAPESLPSVATANGSIHLPAFAPGGLAFGSDTALSEKEAELMLLEDAGKGLQAIPDDSYEPPFKLLQDLSPEVKSPSDKVAGAKPGLIYNKSTGKLYGQKVAFVPCHYREAYVLWKPKKLGGGYLGEINMTPEEFAALPYGDTKTYRVLPDGTEVHDTSFYAVLAVHAETGEIEAGILPMSRSQRRSAREWNRLIKRQRIVVEGQEIEPPIWAFIYLLGSKLVTKNQDSWHVWNVQGSARTPRELLARARSYANAIEKGLVKLGSDEDPEAEDGAVSGGAHVASADRADVSAGLAKLKGAATALAPADQPAEGGQS